MIESLYVKGRTCDVLLNKKRGEYGMSEENMIQYLYDQIDRLISMQNTMLSIVGALFATIIGVFAFFQWRINHRDQAVIIKTAKEELVESLIKNYNLLDINENREILRRFIDQDERNFKEITDKVYELDKKSINLEYQLNSHKILMRFHLLIEEQILYNIEEKEYIETEQRDEILKLIINFRDEEENDFRKAISNNLFRLLNVHSKEKLDKSIFDINSGETSINDKQ